MAKRRKKSTNSISYLIAVIVVAILSALGIRFGTQSQQAVNVVNLDNLENITITTGKEITQEFVSEEKENLQVYFFDVGQADSILVKNGDKTMLIDAGNNEDGELLVKNLQTLQVTKIDYLIGTHPHEDHIGGLDDIIQNFEIENIYMPNVQTNTKTFEDVLDAVAQKGLTITTPKVHDTFQIGEAQCEIMAVGDDENNLNLASIVIQMKFDELTYLFTGDAEEEIEQKLEVGKVNILKAGHHGSDTSSSENFLQKIAPEVAIISVGEDNSYKHPSQTVLDRLEQIGSKVYRTDKVGNIWIEQKNKKLKGGYYENS